MVLSLRDGTEPCTRRRRAAPFQSRNPRSSQNDTKMQSNRMTVSAGPRIQATEICKAFTRGFIGVCIFCLVGTASAMGSGSGGGWSSGGGSNALNNPPQQEVGASTFKAYNRGVDLMYSRKFAEAQAMFEQAIRDNPNFAEAHNNLGFTLREQGPQNYAKALQHYNRAIQLKPKMPETYECRGVLFAKMGRKADAEKDLATLRQSNSKLAGELERFLKTGREEEEYGGTSPKQPARLLACQSSARGESRHSLQRTENATWRDREECEMRKYQPITRTSLRGAEGTAFGDEETEQLG